MKLRVLDLFSGIGGFSLGLERTGGFEIVAFCEIEEYPRKVLAKHWPKVPCYHDIRDLTADTLARDGIAVDVICGGFPCQDISFAGNRAGLAGERSGLWREYARLIRKLRPGYVIVENVAALLSRGLADVLGDLAALGYDAEWHCIPAAAVGAPHRRDRVWIIAYPNSDREHDGAITPEMAGASELMADADVERSQRWDSQVVRECSGEWTARTSSPPMADADCCGQPAKSNGVFDRAAAANGKANFVGNGGQDVSHADCVVWDERYRGRWLAQSILGGMADGFPHWLHEPADVPRVAKGVPDRSGRLKALGNAVVPQIPELIGRAILEAEGRAA